MCYVTRLISFESLQSARFPADLVLRNINEMAAALGTTEHSTRIWAVQSGVKIALVALDVRRR